jgi:ATP-dependent Lon protease
MMDTDIVERFESFGPVPGRRSSPAGLTRLLALRVVALRLSSRHLNLSDGRQWKDCVLATDLDTTLLDYLAELQVVPELAAVSDPDEQTQTLRAVVLLAPIWVRLPGIAARICKPTQADELADVLRIPRPLCRWALAGELNRLHAQTDMQEKLVTSARGVEASWIEAYPDLLHDIGSPPVVEREVPMPLKVALPDVRPAVPTAKRRPRRKAGHWQLADATVITQRLADLPKSEKGVQHPLEPMLRRLLDGATRALPLAELRTADAVERLVDRFPNFAPVCTWVADHVRLRAATREPIHLPPLLLVGPPGIGKTMFCHELGSLLRASVCMRSLAEMSASWMLVGASLQWARGEPGVIAEHLSRLPERSLPWFIFDELDKAGGERNYPVTPALLGLIEPYTACRFRDEALAVELDVSRACFLFTANKRARVPAPLLSRVQVLEVRAPTAFEMPAVIQSVDAQIRREQPALSRVFAPLRTPVLLQLQAVAPRELRRHLLQAYANAVRRTPCLPGRRVLMPSDLPPEAGMGTPDERTLH